MIHEVRHIRAFPAVNRHANFTRTARELHVSQWALTKQIQQLEKALGVTLSDRNKRRVVFTAAGRHFSECRRPDGLFAGSSVCLEGSVNLSVI